MGKSQQGGGLSYESARRRLEQEINAGTFAMVSIEELSHKVVDGTVLVDLKKRTYPDFTPAVNKGAQLLDRTDPDWYLSIDVSALDLDDKNMCVLGQSWNHYKTVADAAQISQIEPSGQTNFDRFRRALFGNSSENSEAAEHGFAFPSSVYHWNQVEAKRRVDEGEIRSLSGSVTDAKGKVHQNASWLIDAELWEHLTKTWLVLIEARQKARAKHDAEVATKEKIEREMRMDRLRGHYRAKGYSFDQCEALATEMYDTDLLKPVQTTSEEESGW